MREGVFLMTITIKPVAKPELSKVSGMVRCG